MVCKHAVYICICQTQQKQTALIHAARETHIECVRMLVEADADLDAIDGVRGTISPFSLRPLFQNELAALNDPMTIFA
jgi:hypothetical protein